MSEAMGRGWAGSSFAWVRLRLCLSVVSYLSVCLFLLDFLSSLRLVVHFGEGSRCLFSFLFFLVGAVISYCFGAARKI